MQKLQTTLSLFLLRDVIEPVAVRYAWAMNPSQRNLLYNEEGLPASPFRTDNWELCDPEADIVEVTKPHKSSDYTFLATGTDR